MSCAQGVINLEVSPRRLAECGFRTLPHPYQLQGIQWLLAQEGKTLEERCSPTQSIILGDEMGLGKTPQILALCILSMHIDYAVQTQLGSIPNHCAWTHPILIVVPKPLMLQWKEEILKHTSIPEDEIYIYHGSERTVSQMPHNLSTVMARSQWMAQYLTKGFRFVITSYQTVVGDYLHHDPDLSDFLSLKSGRSRGSKTRKTRVSSSPNNDDADGPSSVDDENSYYHLDNSEGHPPSNEDWDANFLSKRGPLFHIRFNRIILDEAQLIRNINSKMSRAAIALRAQRRCVLSGTIFNNSSKDLCTEAIFLRQLPYNMQSWWTTTRPGFHQEIEKWRTQHLLRRTKSVLDGILPCKTIKWSNCKMSKYQQTTYDDLVRKSAVEFRNMRNATGKMRSVLCQHLLQWMHKLRQCCNDPMLLLGREATRPFSRLSHSPLSKTQTVCGLCKVETKQFDRLPCGHGICDDCTTAITSDATARATSTTNDESPINIDIECDLCSMPHCPKTKAILHHLGVFLEEDPTNQAVVISQWSTYIDLVEGALRDAGITHLRYDGDIVSHVERNDVVHRFQGVGAYVQKTRPRVLLLSLKAGGLGLNLTAGSLVILADMWFNPFIEDQAVDRCHRIGQEKPVTVQRLRVIPHRESTTQRTIEHYMTVLQNKKRRTGSYYLDTDLSEMTEEDTIPGEELQGIFADLIQTRNGDGDDDDGKGDEDDDGKGDPGDTEQPLQTDALITREVLEASTNESGDSNDSDGTILPQRKRKRRRIIEEDDDDEE